MVVFTHCGHCNCGNAVVVLLTYGHFNEGNSSFGFNL